MAWRARSARDLAPGGLLGAWPRLGELVAAGDRADERAVVRAVRPDGVAAVKCFCGCGDRVVAQHHVFYVQHLRERSMHGGDGLRLRDLVEDGRNLVVVALRCHGRHHQPARPSWRYPLERLPDSVFEFGAEVFGRDRAYEYLRRRYRGEDPRLDALLDLVAR